MEASGLDDLLNVLRLACSQDGQQLKPAEERLASWEKESGFYSALLQIFMTHSIEPNVRIMAALYFKNGVEKYWRRPQANSIKPEERLSLKAALISAFNEPVPQIALQLAVIIGKIARLDCPNNWAELMPVLLERVRSVDPLEQHRSLLVLVHVVKALSSKRLHHDRIVFEQFTGNLYEFILSLYDGFTQLYFRGVQENVSSEIIQSNLEKALLTIRILRKLTIYGFNKPNSSDQCMLFLKVIFDRLKDLLECRLRIKSTFAPLLEKHEKFVLKHMKILIEFQDYHRKSFLEFAPLVLESSFHYVFYEGTNLIFEGNQITFPNFAIHCVNLIKGFLVSNNYNPNSENEMSLSKTLADFFSQERLSYIIDKLLVHYFIMTPAEMALWDEDPETFVGDEGGDSWKYSLRSCTEAFYMILFQKYSSILITELQRFIVRSQAIQLHPGSDIQDILIKESIYNATGLVSFHLFDEINFDEWFCGQLLEELKIKDPHYRILRKRIIWLIGSWTGVKFSRQLRPKVYAACLDLLQPSEDIAVRLTASKTLKNILDDFDFCAEQFLEFLEPCFSLLFNVLQEAKECETKMTILYVMSFIVEKMSMSIKIQADSLVLYLPLLWEEGVDHNMLRCAIISALLQIIKAIFEVPETITTFVYNVIETSTNVNDPAHVYLLDEGLELWLIVVQYSNVVNDHLLRLCSNLVPTIEKSSINMRTCLHIMQGYIYLCPDQFLQQYGKHCVDTCQYLIKDMRPEGIIVICKMFITILRARPDYSMELLKPVMADITKNLIDDTDYLSVKQMYLLLVARYLLINHRAFSQILEEIKMELPLEKLLTIWFDTMPVMTHNEDKKMLALALCSLITIPSAVLQERFPLIIHNINEALNDIMKIDFDTGVSVDSLHITEIAEIETNEMFDMEEYESRTPHYERCKVICINDPVYKNVLKDSLQSQLIQLKRQMGDDQYEKQMRTVDIEIHKNLFTFVNTLVELV